MKYQTKRPYLIFIQGVILSTILMWFSNTAAQHTTPDRGHIFTRMDANADGKLARSEFRGPPPAFKKMDGNGDGSLSQAEFVSFAPHAASVQKSPMPNPTAPVTGTARLFIDVHEHVMGTLGQGREDYAGAVQAALREMDRAGIQTAILLPPPQTTGQPGLYDYSAFLKAIAPHADRFKFLAGGGTLNPMIQDAVKAGNVSPETERRFATEAEKILKAGAVGFGELAAEHLSLNPHHVYEATPPDHPLFLKLADIAAKNGVPIDIHMEAVTRDMPLPTRFASPPNPKTLKENIASFERLLTHNRGAKIIWDHFGWDNLGKRTVDLTRGLLRKHPNLYLSVRLANAPEDRSSVDSNWPVDETGTIRAAWLALIKEFPDRFLMGGDEFFLSEQADRKHPSAGSAAATASLVNQLPEDLKRKVGYENAKRVFGL